MKALSIVLEPLKHCALQGINALLSKNNDIVFLMRSHHTNVMSVSLKTCWLSKGR